MNKKEEIKLAVLDERFASFENKFDSFEQRHDKAIDEIKQIYSEFTKSCSANRKCIYDDISKIKEKLTFSQVIAGIVAVLAGVFYFLKDFFVK